MNLAQLVSKLIDRILRDRLFRATVTGTSGNKVKVQRAGESEDATYYARLTSYSSPTVTDEVICLRLGGGVIVLGKILR